MRIGPLSIEKQVPVVTSEPGPRRDLQTILRDYDVVDVDEQTGVVVVAPSNKRFALTSDLTGKEIGSAGSDYRRTMGGEEYNLTLAGPEGIRIFDKMRRSDGAVRQSLRIAKTPVLAGRWFVEAADPGDKTSQMQADFIEHALFHGMTSSWFEFLTEALLMLDFGYYFFEKVFEVREVPEGDRSVMRAVWRKWAPRHPLDVEEWEYDAHGGPNGVKMYAWDGANTVFIPISKLLVFTYDKEAGNVEGISILRSAYKHWYYKDNLYKVDAIQKERHGIGIPVIKLPANYSPEDKRLANELGRNIRTNERAFIVLPPMWEIEFAQIGGGVVDIRPSIDHHDSQIVRNVLANFVGTETSAAASVQVELFLKATRFIADIIADIINKHAIPELIDFNWPNAAEYPRLGVRRIGETTDWRTLSFAIRNFIGAGVIKPDDPLEDWIRKEMDTPSRDPNTSREVATPQAGPKAPKVGPPRQGKPSANQGQGTGDDRSGG